MRCRCVHQDGNLKRRSSALSNQCWIGTHQGGSGTCPTVGGRGSHVTHTGGQRVGDGNGASSIVGSGVGDTKGVDPGRACGKVPGVGFGKGEVGLERNRGGYGIGCGGEDCAATNGLTFVGERSFIDNSDAVPNCWINGDTEFDLRCFEYGHGSAECGVGTGA